MTRDGECVELWRWRVGPRGPPLTAALPAMEAIRGAAIRASCARGQNGFPDSFHGGAGSNHGHAFWLPEDEDGDGAIDHVLVFCANGIDAETVASLALTKSFRLDGRAFGLLPSWMGPRPVGGVFGPAAVWEAASPYVTPLDRHDRRGRGRANRTPEAQLLREIALRGLPAPLLLEWRGSLWAGDEEIYASAFAVPARGVKDGGPPRDAVAAFPRVVFPEPVAGPLAFGFGAHFGLGLLAPRVWPSLMTD